MIEIKLIIPSEIPKPTEPIRTTRYELQPLPIDMSTYKRSEGISFKPNVSKSFSDTQDVGKLN